MDKKKQIEASMLHRRQWVGVKNPPITSILSLNMPITFLDKDHGIGFIMINDKAGLFTTTAVLGQYTYKLKTTKGILNIGIMGGRYTNKFDSDGIYIPSPESEDNESTNNESSTTKPVANSSDSKTNDGGIGLSWVAPQYYIGISVNHLLTPKISFIEGSERRINRTYYLVAGYNISSISSLVEVQPSLFYRTDEVVHQIDLTLRAEYKKFLNGGVSWRKDDGFVFLLGLKVKNIEASYAYDWSTSAIGKVSSGSHEIFLKYSMPLTSPKPKETLKSIRLL